MCILVLYYVAALMVWSIKIFELACTTLIVITRYERYVRGSIVFFRLLYLQCHHSMISMQFIR